MGTLVHSGLQMNETGVQERTPPNLGITSDFRLTCRSQTRQEGTCPNSARCKYTQQTKGACSAWGAQPSGEVQPGASPRDMAPPGPAATSPPPAHHPQQGRPCPDMVPVCGLNHCPQLEPTLPLHVGGHLGLRMDIRVTHLCGKLTYLFNHPSP